MYDIITDNCMRRKVTAVQQAQWDFDWFTGNIVSPLITFTYEVSFCIQALLERYIHQKLP